jgi:hypothetical protein
VGQPVVEEAYTMQVEVQSNPEPTKAWWDSPAGRMVVLGEPDDPAQQSRASAAIGRYTSSFIRIVSFAY